MYSIYTNRPPSFYIYLPPMYTYMIIMIYDNMIFKYCGVHGTSPQLAQADCCHTYTHKQSLRTHVHTPSVSHKTCPYPFSLSQHMSRPLQSLTKTCPDPFSLSQKHVHTPSVSHNTCPYSFSLSQNMSIPLQSLTTHVHTPSVSHKTCPHPFSLSQHMSRPLQFLTTHVQTA